MGGSAVAGQDFSISNNPLGLVEIVRDYGVSELGSLFVYLPLPRKSADGDAWGWVEVMQLSKAVRGGPWRICVESSVDRLRSSHPKLFVEEPAVFEVYRLDRNRLAELIR